MSSGALTIRDVTPRDGLQAERPLAPSVRADLVVALIAAGLAEVEVASFVSAAKVPAMAGPDEVVGALARLGGAPSATWWALVPNARGAAMACEAGIRALTVTVSASAAYSAKNVGVGPSEAVAGLPAITVAAGGAALDVVISCAFGSPFDDVRDASAVVDLVTRVVSLVDCRITLADTTGTATPRRISALVGHLGNDIGLHLHDTRGTALANALKGYELGVRRFDTALGGLGGSPFAPGAGGNLATEDLVMILHDGGVPTGIDLDLLLRLARQLPELVGHPIPGRVAAAGPLSVYDA